MGGRARRAARRACLGAATVCLLLGLTTPASPAQEEDTVPAPEVFRGAASSLVASVQVDRDALIPVSDLLRFVALDGSSTFESSTRQARASLLFPGNGLILGPSLLCGTFGAQFPPELKPILDTCLQYKYPLTVFADDFAPDGASSGSVALGSPGDPLSATAARAAAHAAEDGARTDAALQDLRLLGLPGVGPLTALLSGIGTDTSLLTVDSATSRTDQRIVQGSLVVDSQATLSGVGLVGGLIRIGSLRSVSHVTDDAKGTRTATADLEVSGVTVGGVPAQITEEGLVIGTPSGGLGPIVQQLQSQLNELLRSLDVTVAILGAEERTDADGGAVASVGGLLVEVAAPLQGLPTVPGPLGEADPNGTYEASIQLGATAARGSAASFGPDPVATDPPAVGGEGSFDPGGFAVDAGGLDLPAPEAAAPDLAPAGPAARPDPAPEQRVVALDDLFGGRLGLLYLALMFAVLGLCVAPRLTVPARFPGPPS